ncbi:MAG: carbohydrate-binding family 9-like protein, partial [Anaerolineae bacterium]|nr:carbohydrate-binding family 9-like protein [Anaerolineae bacterium]
MAAMSRNQHVSSAMLLLAVAALSGCGPERVSDQALPPADAPATADPARTVYIPWTAEPPRIDGRLNDAAWQTAPRQFLARVGHLSPLSPASARLLWDDEHLYVGFEMDDYDVRADLTERDSPIALADDCFELFIMPPDGGGISRIELQINPLGALTDIAYGHAGQSQGTPAAWRWQDIRWTVHVEGTINDNRTADRGWSAELALPWSALQAHGIARPRPGDQWRGLLTCINRNLLPNGRTARELTTWPVLSAERFHMVNEYGDFRFVGADSEPGHLEGFAEIVEGTDAGQNTYRRDFRGMTEWWFGLDEHQQLTWRTRPTAEYDGDRVHILFTGLSIANHARLDLFELAVNGRTLLTFQPHVRSAAQWQGDRQVTLSYDYRSGRILTSGVYTLSLPGSLLADGEPLTLSVRSVQPDIQTR